MPKEKLEPKKTLYDIETLIDHNLEVAMEVLLKSESSAKLIGTEFLRQIHSIYRENVNDSKKDFESFFKESDELCKESLMAFILLYFPHKVENGFESFQPAMLSDLDGVLVSPDYNKLILTGYQGCGKSMYQLLWGARNLVYKLRICPIYIGHTIDRSSNLVVKQLNLFNELWVSDSGRAFPNLFSYRFGELTSQLKKSKNEEYLTIVRKSMASEYALNNGTFLIPVSVEQVVRGIQSSTGIRFDSCIIDEIEDVSWVGTAKQDNIWNLISTAMNRDTTSVERPIASVVSGNYTEAGGNIEKLYYWGKDETKKTKFFSQDLIDEKRKICFKKDWTFERALREIDSSDRPQEWRNDPKSGTLSSIDMDKIKYIPIVEVLQRKRYMLTSLDPAASNKEYSDSSGITYIYILDDGDVAVWGDQYRLNSFDLADSFLSDSVNRGADEAICEVIGNQNHFAEIIDSKLREKSLGIPVRYVSYKSQGKAERLHNLKSLIETGTIKIVEEHGEELLRQIAAYTFTTSTGKKARNRSRVDILDSLEQGMSWLVNQGKLDEDFQTIDWGNNYIRTSRETFNTY